MHSVSMSFHRKADAGQVTVSYRDLFSGQDERPTHTDPNRPGVPYKGLQVLSIRGQRFLPVYPGLWFGAHVYLSSEGSILTPVTLGRTDTSYTQNLWRLNADEIVTAGPNEIDETLGWVIPRYSGKVISGQVDKTLRDAPDPHALGGRVEPFLVSPAFDGSPQIEGGFDQITIWRRSQRMPTGTMLGHDDSISRGTGTFAENALAVDRVTLIWRETAEQILRGTGVYTNEEEIPWA